MFKRLFYALNNNKQFNRQIQLLYYLSSVHSSVSIIELAEHVGCSIPTLKTDIKDLNDNLPPEIHVDSLGKNGYFLTIPDDIAISKITLDLAKKTDVYRLIDSIFHNNTLSFDGLTHSLYISPFTLRKMISHINSELKHFEIELTPSNLELTGKEENIRFFFFAFYSDFNDLTVLDHHIDAHIYTYQSLLNCAADYNGNWLHLNFFRTTLWLLIIKQRLQGKHYIEDTAVLSIASSSNENYLSFISALQHEFSVHYKINHITDYELTWIYTLLLHCVSYTEPNEEYMKASQRTYLFHRETDSNLIHRIDAFISLQFDEEIMKSKHIEIMRAFLINLESLSKLSKQYQRLSLSTRMFTKESINKYYLKWRNHLRSKEAEHMFPIQYKDDVAVALSMLHLSLLGYLKHHEVRVLFSFQCEPGYDDFLIHTSQLLIPHSVHPYYLFDETVTLESIKELQIDLVVSNYALPSADLIPCKIVRLSYIPTLAEWTYLNNLIHELSAFDL